MHLPPRYIALARPHLDSSLGSLNINSIECVQNYCQSMFVIGIHSYYQDLPATLRLTIFSPFHLSLEQLPESIFFKRWLSQHYFM